MIYTHIQNEMSKIFAVVVAVVLHVLTGGVAHAQSDAPKLSKGFLCSIVPGICLEKPYWSKKWAACAHEAAINVQGCLISADSEVPACTTASINITELAVERTKYGPLFTLLVSGINGNGHVFRYTADCHVSKTGELIEFKTITLR